MDDSQMIESIDTQPQDFDPSFVRHIPEEPPESALLPFDCMNLTIANLPSPNKSHLFSISQNDSTRTQSTLNSKKNIKDSNEPLENSISNFRI